VLDGGISEAIKMYQEKPSAGIIVLESHDESEVLLAQMDHLSEYCDTSACVVVLGVANDVMLFRELLRRGISDYVPSITDAPALVEALARLIEDPEMGNLGQQISFIGAGGGTGSSTMAHNVAWSLGQMFDENVALLDLDLSFGTVALDFDAEAPQDIASVMAQTDRLDDTLLERLMVQRGDRVFLLTAPSELSTTGDVDVTRLDPLLSLLRTNAPFVILDLPCYWTSWIRHVLKQSNEIVVTALPTLASLRNAKNLIDILNTSRVADPPVRLILNAVGSHAKTEIPTKEFEKALGIEALSEIPSDPPLFGSAASTGLPIAESRKKHKITERFKSIAGEISGSPMPDLTSTRGKKGIFRILKKSK